MVSATRHGELFDTAERLFEHGNFISAQNYYQEFLLFTWSSTSVAMPPQIIALDRIGDIAVLFGEWDRADNILQGVHDAFMRAGNSYMAGSVALKRACIATHRGLVWISRDILQKLSGAPRAVRPWWEIPGMEPAEWEIKWRWPASGAANWRTFFCHYYLEAGRIETARGQYERAGKIIKRGFAHSQSSTEAKSFETPLLLALAAAYMEKGDLPSAGNALRLLPGDIDISKLPGYAVQARELSAKIDLLRGNFGTAKSKLESVIEICQERGFPHAKIAASLNLAYVLIFLNQTQQASDLCLEAKREANLRGDVAAEARADFLSRFAADRGQSLISDVAIAPAVIEMQEMTDLPAKPASCSLASPFEVLASSSFLALFEERVLGFYWHLGRHDWATAHTFLTELHNVFIDSSLPTDSVLIQLRLLALQWMLAYYQGEYEQALAGLEELTAMFCKLELKPERWQLLRFKEWCCVKLGYLDRAATVLRESECLLQSMAETLSGADRTFYLLNKWTESERLFAAEIEHLALLKANLSSKGWRNRILKPWRKLKMSAYLAALLDEADQYKSGAMQRADQGDELKPFRKRSQLRRLIQLGFCPRNRATISFLVLPDRILVVRASWCSFEFGIAGVTRVQLRELVRQCHQAAVDGTLLNSSRTMALVGQALQLPPLLASLPKRIVGLTFVPDDILHGLPFAAIPLRKNGEYIIEDFALSVGYEWLPAVRSPVPRAGALAVGVSQAVQDFEELPSALDECRRVVELLSASGVRTEHMENPSKEAILDRLGKIRFLHLACHGTFRPDAPSESGMVLPSSSGRISLLTLREISRLQLSCIEQVFLSSCWSADNFILPGRWVLSLPEVIWHAGARSIVGSLWRLSDTLAPFLTEKFYRAVLTGTSREEALRQAQLACANGEFGKEFQDPAFWAGLRLCGESGVINF